MKGRVFLGLLPALAASGLVVTGILATIGMGGWEEGGAWNISRFLALLEKDWFQASLGYSLITAFLSASLSTILGTLLAWLLRNASLKHPLAAGLYRLPLVWPHLLAAFLVLLVFSDSGLVAGLAYQLGWIQSPRDFPPLLYGGSGFGMTAAYIYKETPFAALMVTALLQRLDPKLLDTARMLGASPARVFFRIALPHIAPALQGSFAILFLYTFGAYDIPYLLGESRPGMVGIRAYDLFFQRDISQRPEAMAVLSVMAVLSLTVLIVFLALQPRGKEVQA